MLGAPTAFHPINDTARALALKHKADAEAKLGKTLATFNPTQYKTQVVAGTNYFIQVDIGGGANVELTIWAKLDQTTELTDAK